MLSLGLNKLDNNLIRPQNNLIYLCAMCTTFYKYADACSIYRSLSRLSQFSNFSRQCLSLSLCSLCFISLHCLFSLVVAFLLWCFLPCILYIECIVCRIYHSCALCECFATTIATTTTSTTISSKWFCFSAALFEIFLSSTQLF